MTSSRGSLSLAVEFVANEIVCPLYDGGDDANVATYSSFCPRYTYAYAFFSRLHPLDVNATFDSRLVHLPHACLRVECFAYYPVAPIRLMRSPIFLAYRLPSSSFPCHLPHSRPATCASALFPFVLPPLLPSP
ncbi:hypothetical protein KC364_g16 [Hortaea werneckii]|nr:hypothetical protein KC364_g16 [Hortaea werneckii]